jgi:putative aminopeptidase FrvX
MKKTSLEFLRKLVESISPSGYEEEAAQIWEAEAKGFADKVQRDCHGNTDAIINPGGGPRVMLAGHYDEIGFLISHIDDDGFLWITPVGGWDPQIPQGHRVIIRGKKGHVRGVMGKCPIHLLKEDARNKVVQLTEMWVDIGAADRKEAEKLVSIGDPMVLDHGLLMMEQDFVAARGFDNRAGAFVVLEAARLLSKMKPKAEIHAVATVQEEIGLRGAKTSAFGIDPTVGIAVDVTFATDYPTMGEVMKREGRVKLGKGPVIARGANINKRLFNLLTETAEKKNIPIQLVAEPQATGTDANAIQLTRAGVATALVCVPNRYMHSSCEVVSLGDLEACAMLIAETVARIKPDTDFIPF